MSWSFDESSARIAKHLANLGAIEVAPLVREASLESLLTETECREIFGAHVYADVTSFSTLATNCTESSEDARRLIQGVHIFQREITRIVEDPHNFDGVRIHFQGAKLHALFYRPIGDRKELAQRALLLQMVIRDFIENVFNPTFPKLGDFTITSGSDIGSVVGTRNGMSGDRELLFLGAPANYAAKIALAPGQVRVSEELFDELDSTLTDYCVLSDETDHEGNAIYDVLAVTSDELVVLCSDLGICWDREASRNRIEEERRQFPLTSISVGSAEVAIDLDALSIRTSKRVLGATLFADVAGFTRYIDNQTDQAAKERALRVFHGIRREMSRVIRRDFNGLRIQYQGDRVQALFHMPQDDEDRIVSRVVNAAIGLQSSMAHTLPLHLPEIRSLSLTIGIDVGTTIVSKLGTRGHRDRICIGNAVETAAIAEERHCGGEIALSRRAYQGLEKTLQQFFFKDGATGDYVAKGLTADKVARAQSAAIFEAPAVHVRREGNAHVVVPLAAAASRAVQPGRSYAS